MAGFSPYGDPFERVNKLLSSLDADAAALEAESRTLGSTVDDVEKARARLLKQADAQIGTTPSESYTTASTRRAGGPEPIPPSRQLPPGAPPPRQLPPGPPGGYPPESRIGLPEGTFPKRSLLERNPTHPDEIAQAARNVKASTDASEEYAKAAGRASGAERDWSAATRESLAAQGTATRNLRAYGALTTEFFSSAARGTVTIRELGYQTVATIQKFGGWLGAGAAIYGALGAVQKIGKGAIDTGNSVQQMSRVIDNIDAEHASAALRNLSQEFNLPIGEVGETAFGVGKAYHDETQALLATKAALYAVKIGELDAGTATQYLIGIINGFHLPASRMGLLFDQLVIAQKRYAIDLPSLMQGVGKAGGAFRAAGGDVHGLIALITTLQHVSGQSGNVIGTALLRSPHFIGTPKNEGILKSAGLNPKQDILSLYKEAIDAAQGQSGAVQKKIAEGLFGPQYGSRVGIFLLQNKKLFNEVFSTTSAKHAHGAAQSQLEIVLDKTSEKISRIGTDLENIGSNLASAGFFEVFKVALGSLQGMLGVTNNLLEFFNKLPKPLKQVVSLALQAGAALKAARFFNVGQSLGGQKTALGSFFTAPNQSAKLYRDALAHQEEQLATRREAASGSAVRASLRAQALDAQLVAAKQAEVAAISRYGAESSEAVAAGETAAATQRRVAAAEQAYLDASLERDIILKEQQLIAEQQALLTRKTTNAQAEAVAGAYGVRIPGAAGSPNLNEAEKIRQEAAAAAAAGEGPVILPSGTSVPTSAVTGSETEALKKASLEKRGLVENLRRVSAEGGKLGLAGGALALAGRGTASKLSSARASIGKINLASIGRGITGLGAEIGAMLGPLDVLILAALFLPDLADQFFSRANEANDALSKLQAATPKSPKALEAQINSLNAQGSAGYNAAEKLSGVGEELAETAIKEAELLSANRARIQIALTKGDFVVGDNRSLFPSDIKQTTQQYIGRLRKGVYNTREFQEAMANLYKTIHASFDKDTAAKLEAETRTSVINAKGVKSRYQDFASLAGKELEKQIDSYSELVATGFGTKHDTSALISRALPQIAEGLKAHDPEKRAYAAKGLDALVKGLQGAAQSELETSLTFAKGQKERNKAYAEYLKTIDPKQVTKVFDSQRKELRHQLTSTNKNIANLKHTGQDASSEEERAKQIRQSLKNLDTAQADAVKELNKVAKEEARDKRFEENTQLFEANTNLRVAELPEGLASTRYQLRRIRIEVQRAIEHYGRDSQQVLQLLTQEQGLIADAAKAQIDLIQAQGEYQVSLINSDVNPVGAARAKLTEAESVLQATRNNPHTSRAEILQAMTDVNSARRDLANEIRAQAEAIKDASFELAKAKAGENDVKVAQINVSQAKYKLGQARTPAEKIQAEAELIGAQKEKQKAIASRQVEDIEFQSDIGKLTLDQQIQAYEHLLKTLDLTRNARRELRRKIHDLKHETDNSFDLNVGDIKLPSIYEVKRAILGGVQGGPQRTEVNTTNHIQVNAEGADANEVVNKLSKTLDGTTHSSLRSAGLI